MADADRIDEMEMVARALNDSPFYKFLEMKVVKIGEGISEVHLQLRPEYKNIWGLIHGGVTAALLDTTCGSSIYTSLEDNEGAMTIDLRVNYLAGAREGLMIGKGKFIYRTRNLAWSQAEALDQQGAVLARAQCIHRVIKRDWGKK